MGVNGKQDHFRIGFLTAIELPDKGFVGGLLVTNHFGRPLEFQCTMPVKANATQEILYGPTLAPFVLGELIGGTLVEKAGIKPDLILTDREQILELRNHVDLPVAFVSADQTLRLAAAVPSAASTEQPMAESTPTELNAADIADLQRAGVQAQSAAQAEVVPVSGSLRIGRQMIYFHAAHGGDSGDVARAAHQIPADANLCEPFDRVREALLETLRCGALR